MLVRPLWVTLYPTNSSLNPFLFVSLFLKHFEMVHWQVFIAGRPFTYIYIYTVHIYVCNCTLYTSLVKKKLARPLNIRNVTFRQQFKNLHNKLTSPLEREGSTTFPLKNSSLFSQNKKILRMF